MPDAADLTIPALADDTAGRDAAFALSTDEDDFLVRQEKATREQFLERVTIVIDGYEVEVPRAVPRTDAQGVELRDDEGRPVPRRTTVYDAARKLVADGVWAESELKDRIPTLCHLPHLDPVAVCRMCSVHVFVFKRGTLQPERKLLPACHLEVPRVSQLPGPELIVTTRLGHARYNPAARAAKTDQDMDNLKSAADKVQRSVGLLAELLLADHKPEPITWTGAGGAERVEGKRYENELEAVAGRLGVGEVRERLRKPADAFGRNRMPAAGRGDTDPRRPHTKPLRRFPLDTLAPTAVKPEDRKLGPDPLAAWDEWNALVDERFPYSSRTVVVDHDKCILCDRCVRSCSDVKPFEVIGHTGKGYATRISFGLDALMGTRERADGAADPDLLPSGCVQCGECMTACPTGALSLRRRVQPRAWADESPALIPQNPNTPFPAGSGFLTADEMRDVWLYTVSPTRGPRVVFPFRSIPYAYLKWNEGAVRRIEIPPGERRELCREGTFGSTAFLLQGTGEFWIYEWDHTPAEKPGFFDRLLGRTPKRPQPPPAPAGHPDYGWRRRVATGQELVLGEMACLTQRPRGASVVAVADPAPAITLGVDENDWPTAFIDDTEAAPVVVYEVTRNLLDMMQRSAEAREDIAEMVTTRAIQMCLSRARLFDGLTPDEEHARVEWLLQTRELEFRRIRAGELVVREGDRAADFYLIRLGTLEVYQTVGGRKRVLALRTSGEHFGEFALLADRPGARTATAAALDPAELVRIPGKTFRDFLARFPDVKARLRATQPSTVAGLAVAPPPGVLNEYVEQGLYQAQRLLALDLTSCTRCDECTRACADSHDGHARLLREGLRFGDFLVAASCRSCHKPYCMEGCPVDAIHRKGDRLEVVIENHCIGCGLCEQNCPYGAIQMVARDEPNPAALSALAREAGGDPHRIAARRAVNCDLCGPVGGRPFCVSACPHDSAVRLTGLDLLARVTERAGREG